MDDLRVDVLQCHSRLDRPSVKDRLSVHCYEVSKKNHTFSYCPGGWTAPGWPTACRRADTGTQALPAHPDSLDVPRSKVGSGSARSLVHPFFDSLILCWKMGLFDNQMRVAPSNHLREAPDADKLQLASVNSPKKVDLGKHMPILFRFSHRAFFGKEGGLRHL